MSKPPASFRQEDVQRAIKAAKKAGLEVARIEIEGGRIVLVTAKQGESAPATETKLDLSDMPTPWSANKRKAKGTP